MKNTITLIACLLSLTFARAQATSSFHSLSAVLLDGTPIQMSQFYGKKLMVVNVASFCAYTPQFEQLETLYEQYRANNFEIIGLPCNDYGRQGGSDSDILNTCSSYNVSFPITQTVSIENNPVHPIFEWLTLRALNGVSDANVTWNFNKFLIDEAGNWVAHYTQNTLPNNPAIIQWILSPSVLSSAAELSAEAPLKLRSSNPAQTYLELEWNSNTPENATFDLIDPAGQKVKSISASQSGKGLFRMDLQGLSAGLYTGKWNTPNGSGFVRIALMP